MLRAIVSCFIFILPLLLQAKEKICLVMIVKNESQVIKRCLDSVKPILDYWVIVDTGSTDNTKEIIKAQMKGIPGELFERPWKNFGHNRSESIALAKGKGDYFLFMDADDTLEYDPGFKLPPLTKDLYNMWRGTKAFTYIKPQLVKASLPWRWVGVTHEYLDCGRTYSSETLEKVRYISGDGGASTKDPQKFAKNVKLLLDGLKEEPDNVRYMFYLAESYRDSGESAKAIEWYQKRVDKGGWEEEVFWSKLQIAHMMRRLGLPADIVAEAYKNAHDYRPHRAEPVYYLAEIYNNSGEYEKAYECLKAFESAQKPKSKDMLFNEDWTGQYGILFQISISSYYVGKYQESLDSCDKLIAMKELPESWKKQAEINRTFSVSKIRK